MPVQGGSGGAASSSSLGVHPIVVSSNGGTVSSVPSGAGPAHMVSERYMEFTI